MYYYCTTVLLLLLLLLLLYYYTVLLLYYCCTTVQYQASDLVDCGGECRLEVKAFNMKGFQLVLVVILE